MSLTAYIKRIDESIPFPKAQTEGSVAFDLASRIDVDIAPGSVMKIPLNVIVEPPPGYWTLMAPRSSTYKLGLIMANSIGVFDPDYCGGEDEYVFIAYNYTQETVHLERGTRIAQILFLPLSQTEVVEMHQTKMKSRGGIGSTGQK